MKPSSALDILKQAYLLEQQGKNLYETARDAAADESVKVFFQDLVDDETDHMALLKKQMTAFQDRGEFVMEPRTQEPVAAEVLDPQLRDKINAAGFEATAITAAVAFEEKAVKAYSLRAEEARDPEEKRLYHWLSVWEKAHLKKLMSLQESLMQRIWNDNSFWPF
ncbi:MAG: ferritin family protein [Desulfobacterales bacterium]|nr:ferritin family protein [Desulfobacterales bacterium]